MVSPWSRAETCWSVLALPLETALTTLCTFLPSPA